MIDFIASMSFIIPVKCCISHGNHSFDLKCKSNDWLVSIWNALVWNGLGEFYLTWEMLSMLNEIMNTEIQWNKNPFICLFVCLFVCFCVLVFFTTFIKTQNYRLRRYLENFAMLNYKFTHLLQFAKSDAQNC